jgi:uncharacterized heparinase superfamily protein
LWHLKPSQVFWRIRYSLFRSGIDFSLPPELREIKGQWVKPAQKYQSLMGVGTFKFLNEIKLLENIGWDGIGCTKLWCYNLHYFDDLNALGACERSNEHRELMIDWVKCNYPGIGVGWDSYPTSLRIVNWIKWSLAGRKLSDDCLQSLVIQIRWLNKNIEWHILGNHLFANAKALMFAGFFFDNVESKKWLNKGLRIITEEFEEQVLQDGGHFELSPMYHSIFVEDVLDLINLCRTFPDINLKLDLKRFTETASTMMLWLNDMCHPDDEISFFNDAAIGIAPSPAEIRSYSTRLNITRLDKSYSKKKLLIKHYPDSGYMQLSTPKAKIFLDVSAIGPNYLPGHGHADTLSFEMSLFGKRVFVNGGTSQYGNGGLVRLEERGTAAHNTVEINGQNSSEVWSGFRVAKRAKPFGLVVNKTNTSLLVSCKHDGYGRLAGSPIHKRSWMLSEKKLLVHDSIDGTFHSAKACFLIHPDIKINNEGKSRWKLLVPGINEYIDIVALKGLARIEAGFFSPEFGVRLPTWRLIIEFDHSNEIVTEIKWNTDG